jgi:hypothetical protein
LFGGTTPRRFNMLSWFFNDGGPLLVLPGGTKWEGVDPPSDGRVVDARFRWSDSELPATDYDRACDIDDGAAVLSIGSSWGLVLGGTTSASAAWIQNGEADLFYLIGVSSADEDSAELLRRLVRGPQQWMPLHAGLEIGAEGLRLLHASSRSDEVDDHDFDAPGQFGIGDGLRFPAPPGRYEIAAGHVEDDTIEALLLRFARLPGRAAEPVAEADNAP